MEEKEYNNRKWGREKREIGAAAAVFGFPSASGNLRKKIGRIHICCLHSATAPELCSARNWPQNNGPNMHGVIRSVPPFPCSVPFLSNETNQPKPISQLSKCPCHLFLPFRQNHNNNNRNMAVKLDGNDPSLFRLLLLLLDGWLAFPAPVQNPNSVYWEIECKGRKEASLSGMD